jgi:hypothetical protein
VKISTIYKRHCRCWVRFTIEDVWFVYEYIFYTVLEDKVKCNFLTPPLNAYAKERFFADRSNQLFQVPTGNLRILCRVLRPELEHGPAVLTEAHLTWRESGYGCLFVLPG